MDPATRSYISVHLNGGISVSPPGAKLKVNVSNGVKGAQVTRVLEVDASGAWNGLLHRANW